MDKFHISNPKLFTYVSIGDGVRSPAYKRSGVFRGKCQTTRVQWTGVGW